MTSVLSLFLSCFFFDVFVAFIFLLRFNLLLYRASAALSVRTYVAKSHILTPSRSISL